MAFLLPLFDPGEICCIKAQFQYNRQRMLSYVPPTRRLSADKAINGASLEERVWISTDDRDGTVFHFPEYAWKGVALTFSFYDTWRADRACFILLKANIYRNASKGDPVNKGLLVCKSHTPKLQKGKGLRQTACFGGYYHIYQPSFASHWFIFPVY